LEAASMAEEASTAGEEAADENDEGSMVVPIEGD
jgi:hypothetical protein